MKRSLPEPLLFRISTFFAVAFAANAVFANGTSMLFAVDSYTLKPEKSFTEYNSIKFKPKFTVK